MTIQNPKDFHFTSLNARPNHVAGLTLTDEPVDGEVHTGIYLRSDDGGLWPCRTVSRHDTEHHDKTVKAWIDTTKGGLQDLREVPNPFRHVIVIMVANVFSQLLHSFMPELIKGIVIENRRRRNINPKDTSCASHDYCDSNDFMDQAMRCVVSGYTGFDARKQHEVAIMNEARALAIEKSFENMPVPPMTIITDVWRHLPKESGIAVDIVTIESSSSVGTIGPITITKQKPKDIPPDLVLPVATIEMGEVQWVGGDLELTPEEDGWKQVEISGWKPGDPTPALLFDNGSQIVCVPPKDESQVIRGASAPGNLPIRQDITTLPNIEQGAAKIAIKAKFYASIFGNYTPEQLHDEYGPFDTREQATTKLIEVLEAQSAKWMGAHDEDYIRSNEDQAAHAAGELGAGADEGMTDTHIYRVTTR